MQNIGLDPEDRMRQTYSLWIWENFRCKKCKIIGQPLWGLSGLIYNEEFQEALLCETILIA